MFKLETTTDCIKAAQQVKEAAQKVNTREEHAAVWDMKVEVLNAVTAAFETGYFTGKAYEELWEAKHILIESERIAGKRSLETYMR